MLAAEVTVAQAARVKRLTVEEYLKGELRAEVKHEFIAGEVFAMTGTSRAQHHRFQHPFRVSSCAARGSVHVVHQRPQSTDRGG
jgi:hypothetical protein